MPAPGGISSEEQMLSLATRRAVEAAGGLEASAQVAHVGTSQLHRCTSPHHPDSITARDIVAIESIGHGRPGHPHVTRALARAQGFVLVRVPDGPPDPHGLMLTAIEMTKELGDVADRIASALTRGSDGDEEMTRVEAMATLAELGDLEEKCATLRVTLHGLAGLSQEGVA